MKKSRFDIMACLLEYKSQIIPTFSKQVVNDEAIRRNIYA